MAPAENPKPDVVRYQWQGFGVGPGVVGHDQQDHQVLQREFGQGRDLELVQAGPAERELEEQA